jgi:hypothetical protein
VASGIGKIVGTIVVNIDPGRDAQFVFTDLDDLFRKTMRFTSSDRPERYRAETAGVDSAVEMLARLRILHDEDVTGGHIAAVQELIGAASAPLTEQVATELRRWRQNRRGPAPGFLFDWNPTAGGSSRLRCGSRRDHGELGRFRWPPSPLGGCGSGSRS